MSNAFFSDQATIAPYFQPIVSLQTMQIIGYESLGRLLQDGSAKSLGPFFADPSVDEARKLDLDRGLRHQALARMAARPEDAAKLFLNLKPSWIYDAWHRDGRLPTLEYIRQVGIDPSRIVIEITEEEFEGNLYQLTNIMDAYREAGCTIAIDDIGSGFNSFDRIAILQPKILKIDLRLLKKSHTHRGYRAVMQSFSILASQIGASLLVEGVETNQDLMFAVRMGARYVQGYFLAPALPEVLASDSFRSILEDAVDRFCREQLAGFRWLTVLQELSVGIRLRRPTLASPDDADRMIETIAPYIPQDCMRIYVCKGDGKQLSSNYMRDSSGGWRSDPAYRGSNWAWRPYFISNISMMQAQQQGILSMEYTDLDTSESVQTYSYPIGDDQYLFFDLTVME